MALSTTPERCKLMMLFKATHMPVSIVKIKNFNFQAFVFPTKENSFCFLFFILNSRIVVKEPQHNIAKDINKKEAASFLYAEV